MQIRAKYKIKEQWNEFSDEYYYELKILYYVDDRKKRYRADQTLDYGFNKKYPEIYLQFLDEKFFYDNQLDLRSCLGWNTRWSIALKVLQEKGIENIVKDCIIDDVELNVENDLYRQDSYKLRQLVLDKGRKWTEFTFTINEEDLRKEGENK